MNLRAQLQTIWIVFCKDIRLETRRLRSITVAFLFTLLIVVLGAFGFYTTALNHPLIVPGLLWIAIAFAGLLIMTESWVAEREGSAFDLILQHSSNLVSVFIAKVLASSLMILGAIAWTCFLLVLFFQVSFIEFVCPFVLISLLATLGFASAGNLFASLSLYGSYRESFLGTLLFPLVSPALLGAVAATRELLLNHPSQELDAWLIFLCAFDIVAVPLSALLFERLSAK